LVSLEYNEYTPEYPWYRAGQRAGDAMIQWAVLSHSLLTAYKSQATMWPMSNPTQSLTISQGINAFCNDTALIDTTTPTEPQTTVELLTTTLANLNLWNGLLESSRGALNPAKAKCTWAHFKWHEKSNLLTLQPTTTANNPQTLNLFCLGLPLNHFWISNHTPLTNTLACMSAWLGIRRKNSQSSKSATRNTCKSKPNAHSVNERLKSAINSTTYQQ